MARIGSGIVTDGFAMETEIGLFAMKREMIARFLQPFQEAKVEIQPGELVGTVTDDGDGFEPAADDGHRAGIGLRSMRERTEMVVGRLDLISHPGDGTTIEIRVPLER